MRAVSGDVSGEVVGIGAGGLYALSDVFEENTLAARGFPPMLDGRLTCTIPLNFS